MARLCQIAQSAPGSAEPRGHRRLRWSGRVLLQVELALEGVVDRLDQLADRLEQGFSRPWSAVVAVGGPQQADATGCQEAVEFGGDAALVGQDEQTGSVTGQVRFSVDQGGQNLPFVDLGVGQGPGARQAGRGCTPGAASDPSRSVSGSGSSRSSPIPPGRSA